MVSLPSSGSLFTTVSTVTTMELYLIGSLLLITLTGIESAVNSPGKLHLMKRDASDDPAPFPQNNDLPPPGQTNHLPPLTDGMSHTQAPSVDVTQKHTTDNGNVSSIMGISTLCLLSCMVISRFLSAFIST
ncbi:uncharacterized protein [Asterias amurensis]|uniref:uncharacterized protein n=1 Tax=Asterias amurensis TaxID=7602 RepID=UPI003AB11A55